MSKILITGGAGHIGVNTCLEAKERGHEVACFDNFVRPLTEENIAILKANDVIVVRGDVRKYEDFEKFPWIPEGIVHLAGQCGIPYSLINPLYDFDVNTRGVINILEYARTHGKIPVAFASTNKVYTDMLNEVRLEEKETRYEIASAQFTFGDYVSEEGIKENFPLDAFGKYGRSPYGTSKVAADLYCQEYWQVFKVPTIVFRMSCIYGLYQKGVEDQGWVDHFLRKIAFGDGKITLFGNGKQVRDMLFGSDVARAYIDAIEKADKVAGEVFNIGGGKDFRWSLLEAIKHIEEATGKTATIEYKDWRHADQRVVYMDLKKIKERLGWEPTISPVEGVKLMLKAYKEEGLV